MNTTTSDSKNIATLLLVRNIQSDDQQRQNEKSLVIGDAEGSKPLPSNGVFTGSQNLVITEILDARTQKMIQSNPFLIAASDYMQTNEMASRVLSQVRRYRCRYWLGFALSLLRVTGGDAEGA
jgi:hypothetical protein